MESSLHLDRANSILFQLKKENISSKTSQRLKQIRNMATSHSQRYPAPGFTACVAATLCEVGRCQELCQRFILEYCLKYQVQNVGLIFLYSEQSKENHVFAYIGSVDVPQELFVGKGSRPVTAKYAGYKLLTFIDNNKHNIVFVDPLLYFATNDGDVTPILEYCEEHKINKVSGVRDYSSMQGLKENAETIMSNAEELARTIRSRFQLKYNKSGKTSSVTKSTIPTKAWHKLGFLNSGEKNETTGINKSVAVKRIPTTNEEIEDEFNKEIEELKNITHGYFQ